MNNLACNVVQNIQIPIWNNATTPYYPNYRLDNGSYCDSTKTFPTTVSNSTAFNDEQKARLHVFPNPATDYVQLYIKNYPGVIRLHL